MTRFKRVVLVCTFVFGLLMLVGLAYAMDGKTDNTADWFYPEWAAKAKFNQPVNVLDTDSTLGAVSKNGPYWVDTVAFITGVRINFKTLRIDNTVGDGFILPRVSTGEAYDVRLKPGVFPKDQADLEAKVRKLRSEGKPVTAEDINLVEKIADDLSRKLLNTPPEEILEINPLSAYKFRATDLFGNRGDIINKSMPR